MIPKASTMSLILTSRGTLLCLSVSDMLGAFLMSSRTPVMRANLQTFSMSDPL